jgi:hypothetical protein
MFERLKQETYVSSAAEPLPGFFARRKRDIPAARELLERIPTGPALDGQRTSDHRPSDSRRSA